MSQRNEEEFIYIENISSLSEILLLSFIFHFITKTTTNEFQLHKFY